MMREIRFHEDDDTDMGFRVDVSEDLAIHDTLGGWTIEEGPNSEWGMVILATPMQDGCISWQVSMVECNTTIKSISGISRFEMFTRSVDVAVRAITSHWLSPINAPAF